MKTNGTVSEPDLGIVTNLGNDDSYGLLFPRSPITFIAGRFDMYHKCLGQESSELCLR